MQNSSSEPDLAVLSQLAWFEKLLLAAVAMVSGAILVLWFLPSLAAFAPSGWSKMTPVTALGMFLMAASLGLSASRRSARALLASKIAALIVCAVGILLLLSYSGGFVPDVKAILPFDMAAADFGRPSPQASAFFVLGGLSLAFIRHSKTALSSGVDIDALTLIALTLFLLGAYVFQIYTMTALSRSDIASPHTLFCMILLVFVIAERRAIEGTYLSVLVTRGMGGRIVRTLLPGIVAMPFALLLLTEYANKPGWMPATYARAIVAPVFALLTFGVVAWLAQRTNTLERELQKQSLTDELTDVLNRRGFYAIANYAMLNAARMETDVVVFFFDLDGLKRINDQLGHETGSALLKRFAGTLVRTFRKTDIVARLGGDEFVVLANNTQGKAEDLLIRLAGNVAQSNRDHPAAEIAYSAGYVEIASPATAGIDDGISRADALMYEQKQRKKHLMALGAPRTAADLAAA